MIEHFKPTRQNAFLNVGIGSDIEIKELAHLIKKVVGFEGDIHFDTSMPDGTPQKLLDVAKLNALGWKARTNLEEGIVKTYNWYKQQFR
jgi:GDP-L-fucose synthase